ncbi:TPA: hypothetical protein ACK1Z8_002525 [Klebsiella michiganensis]
MSKTNDFNDLDYEEAFLSNSCKRDKALTYALEIRKFEIELYWKRATYFWTFIGASLVAFIAIQSSNSLLAEYRGELTLLVGCLGAVFSFAWVCVNKGSKFWQENWEKHVDMLEDDIIGPLYKVVANSHLGKNESSVIDKLFLSSKPYSVSKINQTISYYVLFIWLSILFREVIKLKLYDNPNWYCITILALSFSFCISMGFACKSSMTFSKSEWVKRK